MPEKKICTLMYHDVYQHDKTESGINIDSALSYKISASLFEKQIKAIREYIDDHQIEESSIRLSFDDGGVSFLTVIAPILEKYGFRGYFFIATGFLNTEGFLNDEQVVELHKRGHFIGSHSHTHRQMMNTLSKEELITDWKSSIDCLERLIQQPIKIASLPNGFCSSDILNVLEELGIEVVYTSFPMDIPAKRGNLKLLGRYGIKDGMNEGKVLQIAFNPLTKAWIKMKKLVLNGAKSLLGRQYIKIREFLYKH